MSYNELLQRGTTDFPIELYEVDEHDPRYDMVSHWHSEIEIVRVLRGSLDISLNGNTYTAGKGDIVFINPEVIHSALPLPSDCIYECLVFDIDGLTAGFGGCRYFFEGLINGEYTVSEYIPSSEKEACECAESIFRTMKHKSSGYKFTVIGELYRFFGIVIDSHKYRHISGDEAPPSDKNLIKLKSTLSYIRTNYDKQITLTDMAKVAEMSSKYFCRFFKKLTRKSPVEYLNTYRVEKAARMLISTNTSVTDIAFTCGFNDLSYFIKTFKMHKGVSPSKFRGMYI